MPQRVAARMMTLNTPMTSRVEAFIARQLYHSGTSQGRGHQNGLDNPPYRFDLERFLQIIVAALLEKIAGIRVADVSGAEDDPPREVAIHLTHPLVQLLTAHAGHFQIGDDQVVPLFFDL